MKEDKVENSIVALEFYNFDFNADRIKQYGLSRRP